MRLASRLLLHAMRILAWALLAAYLVWNVYWLTRGRIPPSLFLALTGLPAPTTGGTRSILRLLEGDWRESLRCHPLAVPIALLFLLSLGWLLGRGLTRRRLVLPEWFLWTWGVCL